MKYFYCTLFDSNYLTRGLAMLESLHTHSSNYHLYILCMDETSYQILNNLNPPNTTRISLRDFEDQSLLSIKPFRTKAEYCWTCTPSVILYCIQTYNLPHCTYLDADLYFFDNPNILIDEMQNHSVLITEHRYAKGYDQSKTSGIYCVQFMTFKSDQKGLKALQWWRDQCIQWCYARFEDGKFGDQKYLDDWPSRFEGVYVMENLRGGLAPWNIKAYSDLSPIFYHFHYLKFIGEDKIELGGYTIPSKSIKMIYIPYIKHLLKLRAYFMPHNYDSRSIPKKDWKTPLRYIKRKLTKSYNIFHISKLLEQYNGNLD